MEMPSTSPLMAAPPSRGPTSSSVSTRLNPCNLWFYRQYLCHRQNLIKYLCHRQNLIKAVGEMVPLAELPGLSYSRWVLFSSPSERNFGGGVGAAYITSTLRMGNFERLRKDILQRIMRVTHSFDHESLQAHLKSYSPIVSFVNEGNLRRPTRPRWEQSPRPAQLRWSAHSPPPRRSSACRSLGRNRS